MARRRASICRPAARLWKRASGRASGALSRMQTKVAPFASLERQEISPGAGRFCARRQQQLCSF